MSRFLIINPGSTSTKIALFQGENSWQLEELASKSLPVEDDVVRRFSDPMEQLQLREDAIAGVLSSAAIEHVDAVAGRGGLTRPLEAGSYAVSDTLIDDLSHHRFGIHASNLGAVLARRFGERFGVPSLIADPVGVDQFEEEARYSGWPSIPRKSMIHALNIRSVARESARELGGSAGDFNFIIAHLGGGISVTPMRKGRMIDVNNANEEGPFSPQRTGTLPLCGVIDLAFSSEFSSADEMKRAMVQRGGLFAYLGTPDGREVCKRIAAGDQRAESVYKAMAYQISKEIGAMATALKGKVDAVVLTGGLPHPPLSDWITERCSWIAPVKIIEGEREMLALAQAAARHVCEGEPLLTY
ncbi:butyrate kinase [Sediminispirochaeta bajacaliforniensis]|uniref:butyrate kinase n=1 Tax=Sediminispirochaeta bajacaliforniensis TaxID=148 RepID=UPI000360F802|nr:butyrate kinase [Sediminispirochaeta bajacaliforniensis]